MPANNNEPVQEPPTPDQNATEVEVVDDDEAKYGKIPEEGVFAVYGTVYCKPEHADELALLYSKMTKDSKTEPGVIFYSIARNSHDPTIFHFFEQYASKAAFVAHTERAETQKILRGGWFRDCVARFEKPIV